ncbi:hypothetical protein NIES4071_96030 [Calothrix sp. NIES-4071]|nr:hypothetical protein NIES4071_96030 [Calothrix sp. NIES-4071]BAZ63868.1 hypothetical protein NIES4105_95960 [Calothrix sp. NIES-4105]
MSNLGKKRLEATSIIVTCALGNATVSVAPTPGVELPKQFLLTASDVLMYSRIWKTYFEEDLSSKSILEILTELGLVCAVGAGTGYVVSKASTAILKEIVNWTGPLGWGVTATVAGSVSGIFGAAWALYCDNTYQQKHPLISIES